MYNLRQLEDKLEAVRQAQAAGELLARRIVPLFVAHMACPTALGRAEQQGMASSLCKASSGEADPPWAS